MGRRLVRWVRASLPGLAVMGLLAGTVALLVHRDRVEGERWREAEQAKAAAREAVFARGQLGEMLELCREGWTGELNFNYEPVALAWTRQDNGKKVPTRWRVKVPAVRVDVEVDTTVGLCLLV